MKFTCVPADAAALTLTDAILLTHVQFAWFQTF